MGLGLAKTYNRYRYIRCPYCGSVYSINSYWYMARTLQFNYKDEDTRLGILGIDEWERVCTDCIDGLGPDRKRAFPWIISCYRPTLRLKRAVLTYFVWSELCETTKRN